MASRSSGPAGARFLPGSAAASRLQLERPQQEPHGSQRLRARRPSPPSPAGAAATLHRLFGLDVAIDLPLTLRFPLRRGRPDLSLRLAPDAAELPWRRLTPLYRSPYRGPDGDSAAYLYRLGGRDLLRFPGCGVFSLRGDEIAYRPSGASLAMAELQFLGPVLAYWLEQRGHLTLHASAVALEDRAVAFLSQHGGGKSGLAAAILERAGGALLTDDVLAVAERDGEHLALPSFPHMRMWPDEAQRFLGAHQHLPRVHPEAAKRHVAVGPEGIGRFQPVALPLAALFVAQRRAADPAGGDWIDIRPVPPAEAVIELVRHSFVANLVAASGLQAARLASLARLARRVPLYRLSYPSGFDRIAGVVERVSSFLAAHPPERTPPG